MATLYEVQSQDIEALDALDLTKLLKKLLHLEARSEGIRELGIEVGLKITVADGGEDGRIEWNNGPNKTNFLPSRLVQFQNKAFNLTPKACADEIVGKDSLLKPMIDDVFKKNGTYIIFTTATLNEQKKRNRIKSIRARLRELGKSYADSASIKIYDSGTIQGWVNHYASAITAVLTWINRPLIDGLLTWEQWEELEENKHFEFVADDARSKAIESLRRLLNEPRNCARILGISGLGKTRLALETCRPHDGEDGFTNRVIYYDSAYSAHNIPGLIESWITLDLECILIIDNCELSLHKKLRKVIERPRSKISLLTLHYNTDIDDDSNLMRLDKMNDKYIKALLEPIYGDKITDLDRIVSFAQGFPLMAVLLARARLEKTADMGRLTDDELANKMLWRGNAPDPKIQKILQACSLFDKFGLEDEIEVEAAFIAESIAKTNLDDLYTCIRQYENIGIVNRAGRYAQIIPKPLAIRLAAEWWRFTRPERQQQLIEAEMPGQLEISFCDQISKLDFLPEVKQLTENLCGTQGPFGQAEVILSDRGSRLFRALVEVNPEATSEALYKTLLNMSRDNLLKITGDTRRNLIWALEKLCFHKEVFEKSAKCLLWLAAAENEEWANNATGQFIQLFATFLSGTEAPPEARFALIEFALKQHDDQISMLAVKALGSALDTYHSSRTVGAEYQGSGKPLTEWRPKIWDQAFSYWITCIEKLTDLASHDNEVGNAARDMLGQHIRGLSQSGERVAFALDKAINQIIGLRGPLWTTALDSIKQAMSYDFEKMPNAMKAMYQKWLDLLRPTTIEDKITLIISIPSYEHRRSDDGQYIDVAAINADDFSKEFSDDIGALLPNLSQLLTGEQRQGFWFGRCLVVNSQEWEPLLSESIKLIQDLSEPNLSFLLGLMSGLYEVDEKLWHDYIALFKERSLLKRYYPDVIQTGQINLNHLRTVIDLIDSGDLEVDRASVFTFGRALSNLDVQSVTDFANQLSHISTSGGWVAIDILSMYSHGEPDKWDSCIPSFKKLMVNLPLNASAKKQQLELHHWKEAALKFLELDDAQFAIDLMKTILNSPLDEVGYTNLHHYVKPVMRALMERYAEDTWPLVSAAILNASNLYEHLYINLLKKEDSFSVKQTSLLTALPEHFLHDWCKEHPERAPFFVARTTEVYIENDETYNLSSTARFLIDEFGHDIKLLNVLSSNMGSFGWSGSVVPRYEKEVSALEPLLHHKIETVRDWANERISYLKIMIKKENMFDEERELGIR